MNLKAKSLNLKVLHICTHDSGGAFTAAFRIHTGMRTANIDSKMLVLFQTRPGLDNVFSFLSLKKSTFDFWEWFLMHFYNFISKILFLGLDKTLYSFHFTPFRVENCSLVKEADVVHLHWVAGFINYSTFFKSVNKKIFWTLHDLNPMLGGFHYEIYQTDAASRIKVVDKWIQNRKREILKNAKFYTICPSNWIREKAEFYGFGNVNRRFQCYYGVDTKEFYLKSKANSREKLDLNRGQILVLFVAEQILDYRKGLNIALQAINNLTLSNVAVVTVGSGAVSFPEKNVYNLGKIDNVETMGEIYSACDFLIVPSLEDNLPNIIIEANLCGLPVLGLESSGIKEMIFSGVNGYYMDEGDKMSFSIFDMCIKYKNLRSDEIVKFAQERYEISYIVTLYVTLYEKH